MRSTARCLSGVSGAGREPDATIVLIARPHRTALSTAPHRTGGPDVAVRTVLARTLMLTSHPPTHNREPHDTLSTPGGGARGKAAAEALLNLTWCTPTRVVLRGWLRFHRSSVALGLNNTDFAPFLN